MRKIPVAFCLALLTTITLSSCASLPGRSGKSPLDYRDSLILPKGTVIKAVPFFINGEGKDPTLLDFTTDSEGCFLSNAGMKAVRGS